MKFNNVIDNDADDVGTYHSNVENRFLLILSVCCFNADLIKIVLAAFRYNMKALFARAF